MRRAFLIFALCSLSATADARCRQMGVGPELLNPDRALAADAALVVRLVPTPGRQTTNTFPAMTLTRGSDVIALRQETLTPSLARFVPASRPAPGRWRVEPIGREVVFGTTSAPALAAPRVASALSQASARGRRGSQYTVTATLSTPAPAHALAAFAKHDGGTFGDARGIGGRSNLTVFDWRTRCLLWPDGMTPPPTSGTLLLRFVGEDGQLSAPSNATRLS